jgi:hypothetical protein
LADHGHLIFIAPAHTVAFFGFESDQDGWKRFNHQALKSFLSKDLEVVKTWHLNPESTGLSVLVVARKV